MLPTVPVHPRRLDEYREPAGDEAVDRLRETAAQLKGARILHVSATAFRGGVAELLLSHVGLLGDLGIEASWQVLQGSDRFSAIAGFLLHGLQGDPAPWDERMASEFEGLARENADLLAEGLDHDFVVVHDPQPAVLLSMMGDRARPGGAWVWRCHQDLSSAVAPAWEYLAPYVAAYDAAVFTMDGFVPPGYRGPPVAVIPPSIDPLSARNQWIDPDTIYEILHRFGVQWTRPIVTQVAPFDPSKDPLGVIDAYRLARDEIPDLQLALIGSVAREDPESWHYLEVTERHRGDDPNVFVLSNLQGVGHLEVNAFQRDSRVILQKSLREGFGLTVSESMWKGTPVIGGDVGGIRLQIEDGVSGYLVDSVEGCAGRLVELVGDEELHDRMSEAGRRRVRERFLTLREIDDTLALFAAIGSEP